MRNKARAAKSDVRLLGGFGLFLISSFGLIVNYSHNSGNLSVYVTWFIIICILMFIGILLVGYELLSPLVKKLRG